MKIDGYRCYVLVGDPETWRVALRLNQWGFSERSKGSWNTSVVGDHLAFYVASPVKKIIGFGILEARFIEVTKVWPDEKIFDRPLWKYRFGFRNLYTVDDWNQGISVPPSIMLNVGRKVLDRRTFTKFVVKAGRAWQCDLLADSFK